MKPRKPIDLALVLLCGGIVLLMPPLVWIFDKAHPWLGIPLPALYVFGVWIVLMIGAAWLARHLPPGGH